MHGRPAAKTVFCGFRFADPEPTSSYLGRLRWRIRNETATNFDAFVFFTFVLAICLPLLMLLGPFALFFVTVKNLLPGKSPAPQNTQDSQPPAPACFDGPAPKPIDAVDVSNAVQALFDNPVMRKLDK